MSAQQGSPTQSTTTFQSSVTGSATSVTPPKYYIGILDLSTRAVNLKDAKKCKPPRQPYQLKSDLKDKQDHYLLGEAPFVVQITATDGCPVSVILTIAEGTDVVQRTPDSPASTFIITPMKAGSATLHAVEVSLEPGAPTAPPANWNLTVEENTSKCIRGALPQKPPKKPKTDVSWIMQYLGNPTPYSFQVVGEKLIVYSSKPTSEIEREAALKKINKDVQDLLALAESANAPEGAGPPAPTTSSAIAGNVMGSQGGGTKPAYSIELSVPHPAALGDLSARLSMVNYSDFAIQNVGSSKVRISSMVMPACSDLTALLRDLRDVAWTPQPDNPVAKLFFLNASDITGALGSGAASPGPSPSSSSTASGDSQARSSAGGGTGAGSGPSKAASATSSGSTAVAGTPGSAQASTTQTPPVGAATSPSAAAAPGPSGSGSGSGGASAAARPPAAGGTSSGTSPTAPASPTVSGVGTDALLFQDIIPGDDAAVTERKRLVALLDLPRPQMIINVWSLQTSLTSDRAAAKATDELHKLADRYNGEIQEAINRGWLYLRNQISEPASYFDLQFYRYITGLYVQDPDENPLPAGLATDLIPQVIAQRIIKRQTGPPMPPELRRDLHVCPPTEFCLGYTSIFQPLQPRLTDLLVATIASNTPAATMNAAVNFIEEIPVAPPAGNCVESDREGARNGHFYLECFRAVANSQFSAAGSQPSALGLLRAALADFLFEYKLSQMYPHEFDDYYLSQTAQTLDARLAPLVDAFNRDLTTFQGFWSERMMNPRGPEYQTVFGPERPKLVNNGMISVRTISGFESTVSTTSQNFLDATQMPTVSGLVQSIIGAAQTPGGTKSAGMTNVLQNISPIQAQVILGALSAYQSSKVQFGRSLSIDVTPRSLSGASSAELTVKINADEAASPTYYSPTGSGTSADISRVASHDTSTKVRVDSIKLFDVSTFTAVVQKSRTRFPLLPPLVEIPYIGTLVGIPLPVAKQFLSSTAVLSTIIVPTAADIALGLTFTADRMVDSNGAPSCTWPQAVGYQPPDGDPNIHLQRCKLTKARFLSDLRSFDIIHYHSRMVSCLANLGEAGAPVFESNGMPATHACSPDYLSLKYAGSLD